MLRRISVLLMLAAVAVLAGFTGAAWAADGPSPEAIAIDTVWVVLAACLVFFMQAGFAFVEGGLTRAKNAGNIMMKNALDFGIASLAYWAIGCYHVRGRERLIWNQRLVFGRRSGPGR